MRTKTVFRIPETLGKAIDEIDRTLAGGNLDLVLDFTDSTFISVDGLEWLEELLMRCGSLNSEISLVNITPSIYKVFKVARIDSVLRASGGVMPSGPVC